MGALIAFELARKLRRENHRLPVHLFISGRAAPQHLTDGTHMYDLPEADFVEEVKRLNGTPREVLEHPELRNLVLPLLRSDFEVVQTYRYVPEPKLDCPISAFGGLEDLDATHTHLEGWSEHTSAAFTLDMLPGDHFFLRTAQSLLLDILSHKLNQIVTPHALRQHSTHENQAETPTNT